MPLQNSRLKVALNKNIFGQFRQSLKGAQKTEHLEKLCNGFSLAIVYGIKNSKGIVSIPTGQIGLFGKGLKGLSARELSNLIVKKLKTKIGYTGPATKALAQGIADSIVSELANARITCQVAGRASKFKPQAPATITFNVFQNTGFIPTPENRKTFLAITEAIVEHITAKGYTIINGGSAGGGSPIATLT